MRHIRNSSHYSSYNFVLMSTAVGISFFIIKLPVLLYSKKHIVQCDRNTSDPDDELVVPIIYLLSHNLKAGFQNTKSHLNVLTQ